ncbi:MAG: hypothetical protein AB7E08_00225 [Candidatus Omnitrophota bacterium]
MEKETSISKEDFFAQLAKSIKDKYKVTVWFAEILGKRWSYLAGEGDFSDCLSERIQLDEKLGLVIEKGLDNFEHKKEEILKLVRDKIKSITCLS